MGTQAHCEDKGQGAKQNIHSEHITEIPEGKEIQWKLISLLHAVCPIAQDMDKKAEGSNWLLRATEQVNDSQKRILAQHLEHMGKVGMSASQVQACDTLTSPPG